MSQFRPARPNDGGPAFPQGERVGDIAVQIGGMTLRDYFSAKAPVSLGDAIAAANLEHSAQSVEVAVCRVMSSPEKRAIAFAMLARLRHDYADAMLKAREVKP